eukprot:TRINITY_DN3728_c0_g1_i4.p1 TRINITY_DN3728_c0_g1~~TRINITY_DN3728_c0_g1_i4.p1  ORF type:complete len:1446 (+),score=574.53 TRINITY_DN3728_c0_g1_i4:156-4493(+)
MVHKFKDGQRVWFLHPEESWSLGRIVKRTNESREEVEYIVWEESGREFLKKDSLQAFPLLDEEPCIVSDMLLLSPLHPPSILHNVRERFRGRNEIYTFVGPILIAVNPFKKLPLYGDEMVKLYSERTFTGSSSLNQLPPHVFSIASNSYHAMRSHNKCQSILISGESGAGKTETAKYFMAFLAEVARGKDDLVGENIRLKIMQCNPILESFGNAKTLRNDNSSRFGKFTKIQFDSGGVLRGAQITNYLLERSRVVKQSEGERNYHVFYQLLEGADENTKKKLGLRDATFFHYLRQSSVTTIHSSEGTEWDRFNELMGAFRTIGISEEEIKGVLRVLAAILHLGNVTFVTEMERNTSSTKVADANITGFVSGLIGVDSNQLAFNLTNRKNVIKGESFVVNLDQQKSIDSRDSLSKALYGNVFQWLVKRINSKLEAVGTELFIGLLDIFGFETFLSNSFEQLCINFANEKLQQHYNRHTFKWELEACKSEEIDYQAIQFEDNQSCLDLIEGKLGVISILDEECGFPKATDLTFLQKLESNLNSNPNFSRPRVSSQASFIVNHYAKSVTYEVSGFLDKNKDSLSEDLGQIIRSSTIPFVANLLENTFVNSPPVERKAPGAREGTASGKRKTTVGNEFKNQLDELMKIINATDPHWIRCIKPNPNKVPNEFNGPEVLNQLNCAGVLETIKIRKMGYPLRIPIEEFCKYFKVLYSKRRRDKPAKTTQSAAKYIVKHFHLDKKSCQIGLTKVFLRNETYEKLDNIRSERLHIPASIIQKAVRNFLMRQDFLRKRKASVQIQRAIRMINTRKYFLAHIAKMEREARARAVEEKCAEELRLKAEQQAEEARHKTIAQRVKRVVARGASIVGLFHEQEEEEIPLKLAKYNQNEDYVDSDLEEEIMIFDENVKQAGTIRFQTMKRRIPVTVDEVFNSNNDNPIKVTVNTNGEGITPNTKQRIIPSTSLQDLSLQSDSIATEQLGVSYSSYSDKYNTKKLPEGLVIKYTKNGHPYLASTNSENEAYLEAALEHSKSHLKMRTPLAQIGEHFGNSVMLYFDFMRFLIWSNVFLVALAVISTGWHFKVDGFQVPSGVQISNAHVLWENLFISTYSQKTRSIWLITTLIAFAMFILLGPIYAIKVTLHYRRTGQVDNQGKYKMDDEEDLIAENKHASLKERLLRRVLSFFLMGLLLSITGGITLGVVILSQNAPGGENNPWASAIISVFYAMIHFLWRKTAFFLTKFERHLTWSGFRRNNTIKFYLLEMSNLFLLYALRWVVYRYKQFKYDIFQNSPGPKQTTECTIKQTGEQFLALMVSELIISNIIELLTPFLFVVIFKKSGMKGEGGNNSKYLEFDVAEGYLFMFYRQVIIYLGFIIVPMIAVLGLLTHAIHYPVAKYRLLRLNRPPPRNEGSLKTFTAIFMITTALFAIGCFPYGAGWVLVGFEWGVKCKGVFES